MSVRLTNPPGLPACEDPRPGAYRQRWAFWRSPPGQPAWARPALLGIAAVAALLYARNIADAGLAPFYSTAVKSMSVSWKAFFYGAFDPQATVTIDKLAGSFLPQALSARLFGFHPWSLALPIHADLRYPDVQAIIPSAKADTTRLVLDPADADMMVTVLPDLPGAEEPFEPVTGFGLTLLMCGAGGATTWNAN